MDRRSFIAGCAGLALSAKAGDVFARSGPLTKITFVRGRRQRRHATAGCCRSASAGCSIAM